MRAAGVVAQLLKGFAYFARAELKGSSPFDRYALSPRTSLMNLDSLLLSLGNAINCPKDMSRHRLVKMSSNKLSYAGVHFTNSKENSPFDLLA